MSEAITQTDALVELNLLAYEAREDERDEFTVKVINSGLPMEIVTRLIELWEVTKEVGGKIFLQWFISVLRTAAGIVRG